MADWTQFPKDLLALIAKKLDSQINTIRFRSVCSAWRSSISPKSQTLYRFPILPNDAFSYSTSGFYLSKRTIYLIRLPNNESSWLIKVEQIEENGNGFSPVRVNLLCPLSNFPLVSYLSTRALDFWDFRVSELGVEYVLQYINSNPDMFFNADVGNLYMEKVALADLNVGIHDYVLLTIHVSGKLVLFRSGDKNWTIIGDLRSPYDDVLLYDGKFYAVDSTGRTVLVHIDEKLDVVAESLFGGDKKCLVELNGELMLIDMYMNMSNEDDLNNEGNDLTAMMIYFVLERTVKFKVYKLDWELHKWIEVKSLGDKVLFWADNCVFSALASDLPGCKGSCIYFTDNFYPHKIDTASWMDNNIGVYSLEDDKVLRFDDDPSCSKMFRPPDWVTSRVQNVSNLCLLLLVLNFPSFHSIRTQFVYFDSF
ncbi:Domain unknown function DUF295 [Dillenia turbinata]|uniref:KIB1-4 beta-propeller domain-containing protein n=1 Tax=Dillenia turbinata TaxID=194707 RepID=A0AAN8USK8_9MAGN